MSCPTAPGAWRAAGGAAPLLREGGTHRPHSTSAATGTLEKWLLCPACSLSLFQPASSSSFRLNKLRNSIHSLSHRIPEHTCSNKMSAFQLSQQRILPPE
eukprot:540841-Rhodomonas_salina.1